MPGKAILEEPRYTNINKQLTEPEIPVPVPPPPQAAPQQPRMEVIDRGLLKDDLCRRISNFIENTTDMQTLSVYHWRKKHDWRMWAVKKKRHKLRRAYLGELILAEWPAGNLSNWRMNEWLLEVYGDESMQEMTELARRLEEHFHVRVNVSLKKHEPMKSLWQLTYSY